MPQHFKRNKLKLFLISIFVIIFLTVTVSIIFFAYKNYKKSQNTPNPKPKVLLNKNINPKDSPEYYYLTKTDIAKIVPDANFSKLKQGEYLPYYYFFKNNHHYVLFKTKKGVQKYTFTTNNLSVKLEETADLINWLHKANSVPVFQTKQNEEWQNFSPSKISVKTKQNGEDELVLTQHYNAGEIIWIFGITDKQVNLKNTFVFNSPNSLNRMIWQVKLPNGESKFEAIKSPDIKGIVANNVVINWADFTEETIAKLSDNDKQLNVYFYEKGKKGNLEIDPTITTTVVGNYYQVYDGTRWWCFGPGFDSGTNQEFFQPGRIYHNSTGAPTNCTTGGDDLLPGDRAGSQANYDQWLDPSGAITSGATNVLSLLEATSTRVIMQTARNTAVDSYAKYTVYPNGYNFINYQIGTATSTNTPGYFIHYDASNSAPQVADNDTTNRTIVWSDTTSNNYAGMAVIPFRLLDVMYVTEFDSSTTYDYYGWYSSDGNPQIESNTAFNYLLDMSNYRATTTTRDNKLTEYQSPDDIRDGLVNLTTWDQFGEQSKFFYTEFEGADSNLCNGGDGFTTGSCAGSETFVGNDTSNSFTGTYSARVVGDATDTDSSYTRFTIPTSAQTRRSNIRFAYRINTETLGNSQYVGIARFNDSGGESGFLWLNQNSSGDLRFCLENNMGQVTCGSTILSTNTWYNLEFENPSGNTTGYDSLRLWLNGNLEVERSGYDTSVNTSFDIGAFNSDTAQNDFSFDNVSYAWTGQSVVGFNPSEGAYTMDVIGWPDDMAFDIDRASYSQTAGLAFLLRKWKTLSPPVQILLNDNSLTEGVDYNTDVLPISEAWINDSDGTCGSGGWLLMGDGGDTSDTNEYLADSADNVDFGSTSSCTWGDSTADALYFGRNDRFGGLNILLATSGAGNPTVTWEYCSANSDLATPCDTWSTLTVNSTNTGTSNFAGSGHLDFTLPSQMVRSTENSGRQGLFFVRARVTAGSYSTYPVEAQIKSDIMAFQYLNAIESDDQNFTVKTTVPEVARWKMDELYGTTLNDDTGKGYNLTTSGATWQKDSNTNSLRNSYLFFDGTNDYLYKNNATTFNFGISSFSISGWFKHINTISGTDTILSKASGINGIGYKIYMNSSGYVCFGIDDTAGSFPADSACSTTSYADNTWHNVAVVKSGISDIYLYVDGILVASDSSLSATNFLDSASSLYLGIDADGTSNPWAGWLDEFVVYSYALTSAQVKSNAILPITSALFGASNTNNLQNGLVGYWKMDESSGNAVDSSGNEYTLTNNGTTTYVAGKFGSGSEHVPASAQHFSTTTTINSIQSVSLWVNPDSTTNYYWSLTSGAYLTSTSGTLSTAGLSNAVIYVNGVQATTVTADTWQHITVTFDSINANQIYVGRQGGNYYDGTIDEVRIYNKALSPAEVKALYNWAPGPVAYYDFNENTGTTSTNDKSGNGYTGTLTSILSSSWVPGKFGSALYLDGSADFIDIGSGPNSVNTVSFWVKPNTTSEYYLDLNGSAYISSSGGTLSATGFTSPVFYVNGVQTASPTITANVWQHIAVTTTTSLNASDLEIGRLEGTDYLLGAIDEVKIYNYVRTPSQIIEDMNGGHPVGGSPVGSQVGYWKFDEGYGNTAYDASPNGNNLTLTNSPARTSSGKINSAIDFESGNSNYAKVADNASLSITGSLTLSAWIRPESNTASTNYVIASKSDGAYTLSQYGDEIRLSVGSSSNYATTTSANLQTGVWYQVIGVYNSSTQTVSIYVNGVLQPSTVTGTIPASISDGNGALVIGADASGSSGGATVNVSQSSDDARQSGTAVTLTGTTLESDATTEHLGFRFNNIAIPQGAIVTSAYMTLYVTSNTDDEPLHYIDAENNDDAPTFTTGASNITNRTYTGSPVIWSNTDLGAPGSFNTPSLTGITQNVIDRAGWVSGNNIVFRIVSNGVSTRDLIVAAWDNVTLAEPSFTYAYTLAGSFYDGIIDEVKIYASALTAEQVRIEALQGKSAVMGNLSTESGGLVVSNSQDRSYCVPGDTTFCGAPVLEWNFNENNATSAQDTSGNGNIGTLTSGPTWVPGKIGSAINFDGADDYVSAPAATSINDLSTLTYEAWIYPTGWGEGNFGRIIDKDNGANTINMFLLLNNTGQQSFRFYRGRGTTDTYADAADNSITLNQWQHVAVSYDSNSFVRLYLNGREVASYTQQVVGSGALNSDADRDFVVGNRLGQDRSFPGLIDQVKVFNYARTPAQIAWSYNRGAPFVWYKFDECSGTTINNSMGNGLNGTLELGASGTTSAGNCTTSGAWYNGANGKYGVSMAFDGSDDYVQVTDTANLRFNSNTQDYSIFTWVKRSLSNTTEYLISKEDADNDGWRLLINYDNTVTCSINSIDITSSATILASQWYHIGCVVDRDGSGQVYINGNPSGSATAISSETMATTSNIRIGTRSYTSTNYFAGQIDNLQIYNYALNPVQIKQIMNSGAVNFQ